MSVPTSGHNRPILPTIHSKSPKFFKKMRSLLFALIVCCVLSFTFGSKITTEDIVKVAKKYSPSKRLTSPAAAAPKNLRTESIATAASSGGIKVNGYAEFVGYKNADCTYPEGKDLLILNTCGAGLEGGSTSFKVMADMTAHRYYATQYHYTDTQCATTPTETYVDVPILHCWHNSLFHVLKEPLNPKTDNLGGFALGIFNNQNDCTSGTPTGLLEAQYLRLNQCYNAGNGSGDLKFTKCQNNVLTARTYLTTDESCTGSSTVDDIYPSDMCTAPWNLSAFSGWLNFVCEM
jgi:hypothetical protein